MLERWSGGPLIQDIDEPLKGILCILEAKLS